MKISASMIRTYDRCPRLFYEQHLRKAPAPSPSLEAGAKLHAEIEALLTLKAKS